jgi:hypothetical protein
MQFLGEPTKRVEKTRYHGVNLDTHLTLLAQFNQMRKKAAQTFGVFGPLFSRKSGLSVRKCVLFCKPHPCYDGLRMSDLEVRCWQPCPKAASLTIQVFSHCDWRTPVGW